MVASVASVNQGFSYTPGSLFSLSGRELSRRVKYWLDDLDDKKKWGVLDDRSGMDSDYLNADFIAQGQKPIKRWNAVAGRLENQIAKWPELSPHEKKKLILTIAKLSILGVGMDRAGQMLMEKILGKYTKFDNYESVMKRSRPARVLYGLFIANFPLDYRRLKMYLPQIYGWEGKHPYPKTFLSPSQFKEVLESLLEIQNSGHERSMGGILEDYQEKFGSIKGAALFALYGYQALFGRPQGDNFSDLKTNLEKPAFDKWIRPGEPKQFQNWSQFSEEQLTELVQNYGHWFGIPKGNNLDEQFTHLIKKLDYHFNPDKKPDQDSRDYPELTESEKKNGVDPNWFIPTMAIKGTFDWILNRRRWHFPYIFNPVWESLYSTIHENGLGFRGHVQAPSHLPDFPAEKYWQGPQATWKQPGEQAPRGLFPHAESDGCHPGGICPWVRTGKGEDIKHDIQALVRPYQAHSYKELEKERKERDKKREQLTAHITQYWGTLTSF